MIPAIVDYIVIGSGIAGLSAARALAPHGTTLIITKSRIRAGSTDWAQGGIAVALHQDDTPNHHLMDTLQAGDGLCDPDAVRVLVGEGPHRVSELIGLGATFDKIGSEFSFTKEAAHNRRRILHAGDSTGREIEKTLGITLLRTPNIQFLPNTAVASLWIKDNRCIGCQVISSGQSYWIQSRCVVLASGGCGQVFAYNTNPPVATGDGIALAYLAGAAVQDMEFTQFHPTTLYTGDKKPISLFLISEAVRGEGGILRTISGERFMPRYHPKAELAPRDIVARAIYNEMMAQNARHVYLDLSEIELDLAQRFPTIFNRCMEAGIDIRKEFIPVAPGAHYFMGGIQTNLNGETTIPGLYAAGEVASLGVHGANRLASNSLLDGLVFGHRAGLAALNQPHVTTPDDWPTGTPTTLPKGQIQLIRSSLRELMWQNVGITRSAEKLAEALTKLNKWDSVTTLTSHDPDTLEVRNLLIVSQLITRFAFHRTESRGAHFRSDYPDRSPNRVLHYWTDRYRDRISKKPIV